MTMYIFLVHGYFINKICSQDRIENTSLLMLLTTYFFWCYGKNSFLFYLFLFLLNSIFIIPLVGWRGLGI